MGLLTAKADWPRPPGAPGMRGINTLAHCGKASPWKMCGKTRASITHFKFFFNRQRERVLASLALLLPESSALYPPQPWITGPVIMSWPPLYFQPPFQGILSPSHPLSPPSTLPSGHIALVCCLNIPNP